MIRYRPMNFILDWADAKARRTRINHKVIFDDARPTCGDRFLVPFPDEKHSQVEDRFISIGTSSKNRVILVVHTEYDEDDAIIIIRFINARKATPAEREVYEKAKDRKRNGRNASRI